MRVSEISSKMSCFIDCEVKKLKSITIKRLTPELKKDYLDFFDNRAFTDDNPNGPCYCTSPNQDVIEYECTHCWAVQWIPGTSF